MTILFEQTANLDETHRVEVTLKEWACGPATFSQHGRLDTDMILTLRVWNGEHVEFGDAQVQTTVLETTQRHVAIREAIKVFDQAVGVVSYNETRTPERIDLDNADAIVDRAYDAFERAKIDAGVTENTQRQRDCWKET